MHRPPRAAGSFSGCRRPEKASRVRAVPAFATQKTRAREAAGKVFLRPPERVADGSPTRASKFANAARAVRRLYRSAFLKRFLHDVDSAGVPMLVSDARARVLPTARRAIRPLKLFP